MYNFEIPSEGILRLPSEFSEFYFQGIEYKPKEESKIQIMSREWSEQNTKFNKLQSHVPPKLFLAYWFHVSTYIKQSEHHIS